MEGLLQRWPQNKAGSGGSGGGGGNGSVGGGGGGSRQQTRITEHYNPTRALNALCWLVCVVHLNESFQHHALQQLGKPSR